MKAIKLFGALMTLMILEGTVACSQNVAEKYWKEKVVKHLFGQEYVNLRVAVDEYSVCNGQEFDILPTDTIEIHVMPKAIYTKNSYCCKLLTKDSLFRYDFREGNYTYGNHARQESEVESSIFGLLLDDWFREAEKQISFYLTPRNEQVFSIQQFIGMDLIGNSAVLWYSMRKPWTDRLKDGSPVEKNESIVAWVDDATGIITRVRRTLHMTSEGTAPADDIIDIRIIDVSFEKVDIDERLYRKTPTNNDSIRFYNINKGEASLSIADRFVEKEDLNRFLNAPLINVSLDTTSLRNIEGWVLVDIWSFGCKPCAKFAKQMEQEQAELGYRKLEHEGIKVVCLNPHSLVTETFKAYVKRFKISDIAYSAQTINGVMDWRGYPYYFLLSPDKKIVYRGNNLGENYENILKAKKEHSKR